LIKICEEVYKYYNDLDYLNGISNSDYMDLSDDLENDENKLEWRYSTKNQNQKDIESRRPKLKKSYTSIDNFHHNSVNDLISPHKLLTESQKLINSQIKKNFLQSTISLFNPLNTRLLINLFYYKCACYLFCMSFI
jgi:hypothetical protein